MACPKHDLTNGYASWKTKQETIKVNAKVKMFKLDLSFCTCAIILSSKPKESSNDCIWFVMATPIMFCTSKNPNCHMTWLPWDIDETQNNNKGIEVHMKHPKVKWICTSNTRCKDRDDSISVVSPQIHIWIYQGAWECITLAAKKVCDLKRGDNFPFLWPMFFSLGFCNPLQQKQCPFFCTNLDVHDKHVFSERLCHGYYYSSQALYVFPEHQGAPIE